PPCSTLFPYTTLFRSRPDWRIKHGSYPLPRRPRGLPPVLPPVHRARGEAEPGALERGGDGGPRGLAQGRRGRLPHALAGGEVRRDRKSTRLNSSHVKI